MENGLQKRTLLYTPFGGEGQRGWRRKPTGDTYLFYGEGQRGWQCDTSGGYLPGDEHLKNSQLLLKNQLHADIIMTQKN